MDSFVEKRTQRFYDHATEAMIFHINGQIIDCNTAATQLCGYDVETLRNKNIYELFPPALREELRKKLTLANSEPIYSACLSRDGCETPVIVRAKTITEDDGSTIHITNLMALNVDSPAPTTAAAHRELEAVRFTLAQHNAILETAVDAIITIDANGIIEAVNPATERMFGYTTAELIGNNISMLMTDNHAKHHNDYLKDYIEHGEKKVIGIGREVIGKCKDGSTFNIHLAVSEIKNVDRILFTGFIRDISQLKATENALRQSEERLVTSQEFAGIGIWDWDLETGLFHLSKQVAPLLGDRHGGQSENYDYFISKVHPEDRQRVINAIWACIDDGAEFNIEHRCLWSDGSMRCMLQRGNVVRNSAGKALRMLGVVQDISDIKLAEQQLSESEARFSSAFETAAHAMAIISLSGELLQVNDAMCSLLGYNQAELKSHNLKSIIHPDDLDASIANTQDLLDNHKTSYQMDNRYLHRDGNVIWVLESACVTKDTHGNPLHFVSQLLDITPRIHTEALLLKAKDQAESANRAKSEFLSSMSHEIRTPLNTILGLSELVKLEGDLDHQQLEDMTNIERAGKHLLELINDILDHARIESGHIDLHLEDVPFIDVLEECEEILDAKIKDKSIFLHYKVDSAGHVLLHADRLRLRQVFLNLLSNAIKYNQEYGQVVITATFCDNDKLAISFTDTGPGIPEEKQTQLFQPFNRLGMEGSKIEGTGIGLTLTKNIVEEMGGYIDVTSQEGKGSTFWVEFKIASTQSEKKHTTLPASKTPQTTASLKDYDILVVEDTPLARDLIKQQLAMLNIVPDFAVNGVEGLTCWKNKRYDLIFTDINMDGMDGYEMTRSIRRLETSEHTTPIVAISANAFKQDIDRYLSAGMDKYLTKPVNLNVIKSTIEEFLCPSAKLPSKRKTSKTPLKNIQTDFSK